MSLRRERGQRQRLERFAALEHALALSIAERHEAELREIAEIAGGAFAHELAQIALDTRNHADVRLLHIEVQRPRDRIAAVRDAVERRLDAVDGDGPHPIAVLVHEAVAEDADGRRIRVELLHDQVVVLAGLDVAAVLSDRVPRDEPIARIERADRLESVAPALHRELEK